MSTPPEPRSSPQSLLRKLSTLSTRTNQPLKTPQSGKNRYFDKSVRITPTFLPGQYVFFDNSRYKLIPAGCLMHEPRSKLLSKTLRPFRKISPTLDTVTIREDSFPNRASITVLRGIRTRPKGKPEPTKHLSRKKCVNVPHQIFTQ